MLKFKGARFGLALLFTLVTGITVWGYAYTWTGNGVDDEWCTNNNWTRTGCGSPCNECPDDSSDDATIAANGTYSVGCSTFDDLTISNADVELYVTGAYQCCACGGISNCEPFDSITISGSAGGARLAVDLECATFGTH